MDIILPSFEVDDKGRVICKSHTQYESFINPYHDYFQERYIEKQLTCKTCGHYLKDDCYFPKSEIDLIEEDRQRKLFACKLCGNKIDRPLTVIQKLYYNDQYNIDMPLICCTCYENLSANRLMESNKWRANIFLYNALYAVYTFLSFVLFFFIYQIKIYFFFIATLPILYLFIKSLKKRKRIINGMKFYETYFLEDKDKSEKIP